MSQLAASDGQPGNWEEPGFFLRRLETVRFQAKGWQEPYESRGSCTVLRGTGGETPPVYPTRDLLIFGFIVWYHHQPKSFIILTNIN
jgi:hypothetical protein